MSTITTAQADEKLALKFLGMSAAIENPPDIGDTQTFVVTARCVGYGADERQSGGLVGYRKMRVLAVDPGAIEKAEPQAEQLQLGDIPDLGPDDEEEDGDGDEAPGPARPYDPFATPALVDQEGPGDDPDEP